MPVLDGRPLQPIFPRSEIWVLLYAQAEQVDGAGPRNVLLSRKPALVGKPHEFGEALFAATEIRAALEALVFEDSAPLSVLAVELFPQDAEPPDPLGADLGTKRILRTSALTAVPAVC
jgi:hypothetical protein